MLLIQLLKKTETLENDYTIAKINYEKKNAYDNEGEFNLELENSDIKPSMIINVTSGELIDNDGSISTKNRDEMKYAGENKDDLCLKLKTSGVILQNSI